MADYFNPSSGLPDPNTYERMPGGGFWTGKTAADNQLALAPFRQNALSQQDLALQEAKAKFGEWSDPNAVAGRQQSIAAKMATDTGTVQEQPSKTQYNIDKALSLHRMLPMEEQNRLQELKKKLTDSEGTASAKVFNELADSAQQLEKIPPAMREPAYNQMMEKVKAENPGQKIPNRFLTYSPEGVRDLQLGFMARVESVGDQQKKSEQAAKDAAETARNRETIAGHIKSSGIAAGATIKSAQIRADIEKPVKPDLQANMDSLTLNSPAQLRKFMQKNEMDEDSAKSFLQTRIQSNKEEHARSEARKNADSQINEKFSLPANHPNRNKTWNDYYQENLSKMSGTSRPQPSNSSGGVIYQGFKFPNQQALDNYKAAGGT